MTPVAPGPASAKPELGIAQFGNAIITVHGCNRLGTQVSCETEISNQNKTETLLQSSMEWADAYIIDDRGDRHPRSIAYFLNIDGDKRVDLDVPYGQSVRYLLMFNDVQAKVAMVFSTFALGRSRR